MPQVKDHRHVRNRTECRPYVIETLKFMYDVQLTANMSDSIAPTLARPRYPSEVLFAIGGWSGGSPTAAVETYDTKSDRWVEIPEADPHGPRAYHRSVVWRHYIYVIGGFDGVEYFNSCRRFDTLAKTWEEVAPMNCKRYVACASVVSRAVVADTSAVITSQCVSYVDIFLLDVSSVTVRVFSIKKYSVHLPSKN